MQYKFGFVDLTFRLPYKITSLQFNSSFCFTFLLSFNRYQVRGSSYKECFNTGWGRRAKCESKCFTAQCNKSTVHSYYSCCFVRSLLLAHAAVSFLRPDCFLSSQCQSAGITAYILQKSDCFSLLSYFSVVRCVKPADVPNGRSLWVSENDPKYGEVVQYSCNEGYTLTGKAVVECGETGEYDSPPPECKGKPADSGLILHSTG